MHHVPWNFWVISFSLTLQKSQLSLLGGKDGTQQVYNIVDKVMPHHVGARFGWLGKPNHKTDPAAPPKIPFASTKLAQAMIGEYETHTFKILMKICIIF